jgi:hypothetical protein
MPQYTKLIIERLHNTCPDWVSVSVQRDIHAVEGNIYSAMCEGQRCLDRQCCALADILRAADILLHVANPNIDSSQHQQHHQPASLDGDSTKKEKAAWRQPEQAPSARKGGAEASTTEKEEPPQDIMFQVRYLCDCRSPQANLVVRLS